jgi:hypothetical protein
MPPGAAEAGQTADLTAGHLSTSRDTAQTPQRDGIYCFIWIHIGLAQANAP